MEIAQIIADGRPGGGTTMLLGLLDDLAVDRTKRITVVSQPSSYMEREVLRRGLQFIGFDFFRSGRNFMAPWLLARKLAGCRFDLTHVHGLRSAHHATQWPVRGKLGRLVYTNHGLHQLHLHPLVRWAANRAERQVARRVDQCVFVSNSDLAQARDLDLLPAGTCASVVWNGIDVDAIQASRPLDKDIDVAFIGRMVEQKQPLLAARVLAGLAAAGWRCALVGSGPLETPCRDLLRRIDGGKLVHQLGELPHTGALEVLARTRVVLMPSAWEGLPILPMEAMALRATLVGSKLPGIAEVVTNGVTGILMETCDAAALREAAERILTQPALEHALVHAAAHRVRDLFDRQKSCARYLEIYRAALQERRHPQVCLRSKKQGSPRQP